MAKFRLGEKRQRGREVIFGTLTDYDSRPNNNELRGQILRPFRSYDDDELASIYSRPVNIEENLGQGIRIVDSSNTGTIQNTQRNYGENTYGRTIYATFNYDNEINSNVSYRNASYSNTSNFPEDNNW